MPELTIIPKLNLGRVDEVLGMKVDEFTSLEYTILGAIDSVIKLERQ